LSAIPYVYVKISRKTISIHLIFWLGYYVLLIFIFSGREIPERAWRIGLLHILPQMAIAYANMEWLIPRFFMRKQYLQYTVGVVLCFVALYGYYEWLYPIIHQNWLPPTLEPRPRFRHFEGATPFRRMIERGMRMGMIVNFSQALMVFSLSTAYKVFQIAQKREKEAALLKSENLQSELRFLKSQINPHFLFNALNNIYTLSLIGSEKTPEMILKLSDMLRYIIYDCSGDRVSLSKEVDYIRNYVDLQRLKDDNINIKLHIVLSDRKATIAPMVLIPFVENSFKHSKVEDTATGWIKIQLHVQDSILTLNVSNSRPASNYTKDKTGGVGLENVKRRLELTYPGRHRLQVRAEDQAYHAELTITL
jgi:hypothetical protein